MTASSDALREALATRVVVADGAMGTMLQAHKPSLEDFRQLEGCNEVLNVTRPDIVRPVAEGLLAGGADALLVETTQDLLQTKASVIAVRRAMATAGYDVPLIVSVTVETTGTMLLGSEIGAALTVLEPLGIDLIGLNCATGPAEMSEHLRYLARHARTRLSCMPNAGPPVLTKGGAHYPLTARELADAQENFVRDHGLSLVGGCCGTTPEHLRQVVEQDLHAIYEGEVRYARDAFEGLPLMDALIILDDEGNERTRFSFPRQPRGRRLCLADFFRPEETGEIDVVGLQVVTVGSRIGAETAKLFEADAYRDYLELHGLSVQLAEAIAEYWHARVRAELGFAGEDPPAIEDMVKLRYRGARFSLGYGACPNLEDRAKIVQLLEPGRIGVELSEEFQLHPEQSTDAIVIHHPEATYCNAGGSRA